MTLLAQGLDLTRMHEHPSARSGLELVRVSLWCVHAQVGLKCVFDVVLEDALRGGLVVTRSGDRPASQWVLALDDTLKC